MADHENFYTRPPVDVSGGKCPFSGGLGDEFNPFEDPYLSNPWSFLEKARREEPIFYSPLINHWVVTRYDDVRRVLGDPESFSNRMSQSPVKPWPKEAIEIFEARGFPLIPNLNNSDPPEHTKLRAFMRGAFTPRKLKWLEQPTRDFFNEAIDDLQGKQSADIVKEVFHDTPARVLFKMLGIPDEDIAMVKGWSEGRALLTWGRLSDEEIVAQIPSFCDYLQYCFDRVDALEANPGEDYISELIQQWHAEKPEGITKQNIAVMLFGLLMAGHDTTTNLSGNTVRALLTHREQWELLCQDPSLIPNAVEEGLRYEGSVIAWRRVTTRDVEIAGVEVPANSMVLVVLGSANRDRSHFSDPDTFDIRRENARDHLSFSFGPHFCMGSPLARLEMKVYLEELTRRIPSLRMVPGQKPDYLPNTSHRGSSTLLVEWDRIEPR
ncbi:cytochrome P450 [Halomonas ramblicola]|uniref:cytochrome P450 n=1 Tax=Halomonas ramblicola TaxID=747349 RepID=UPI0025B28B07|nr:cytochrome P450 [Halomonas ramblicola]MDN3521994.1 cytochrome P450 [Halomonas ramblicola]